jgi:hypothetical protein
MGFLLPMIQPDAPPKFLRHRPGVGPQRVAVSFEFMKNQAKVANHKPLKTLT